MPALTIEMTTTAELVDSEGNKTTEMSLWVTDSDIHKDAIVHLDIALNDMGFWLWRMETRPEYRNQGLASKALRLTAEEFGANIVSHDGHFTPLGYERLSHLLHRPMGTPETAPTVADHSYVTDWSERILSY